MANYNGGAYIASSLGTVLAQTLRDFEVIVVDDASTDASVAIVAALARQDPRIRLLTCAVNLGAAAARNTGLDQARGRWIAVVDSDDLIHPERLERLLQLAEAQDSDIAADNLLVFGDDPATPPHAFLTDAAMTTVDLAHYLRANAYNNACAKLGYLKPLFRTDFVRRSGARYQPELQVAEDAGFAMTLLAAGARFHIFPDLTYFYRKHAGSVSHRLTAGRITAMMANDVAFRARLSNPAPAVLRAFAVRRAGFAAALQFDALVQALKTRRWLAAAGLALRHRRGARMLWPPAVARFGRIRRKPPIATPTRPQVCIITRRPVTTEAQQVMAPLIRLAALFAAAGADAHLVVPAAIGPQQRKALARAPGIDAFASVNTRPIPPGVRSSNPAAPTEIWTLEEKLFVADAARPVAQIVVADWLPGIEALPFTLCPDSLVLALVEGVPRDRRTGRLPGAERLARADVILVAEADDARLLREACPATPIVMLATGRLFGPCTLTPVLVGLIGALWPQPAQPRQPLTLSSSVDERPGGRTPKARPLGARGELQH